MKSLVSSLVLAGLLLTARVAAADPDAAPIRYDARTHTYSNVSTRSDRAGLRSGTNQATRVTAPRPSANHDPDFVEYTLSPAPARPLPPPPAMAAASPPPVAPPSTFNDAGYGYAPYGYYGGFGSYGGYGYGYGRLHGLSGFGSIPLNTYNVYVPGHGVVPNTILSPYPTWTWGSTTTHHHR